MSFALASQKVSGNLGRNLAPLPSFPLPLPPRGNNSAVVAVAVAVVPRAGAPSLPRWRRDGGVRIDVGRNDRGGDGDGGNGETAGRATGERRTDGRPKWGKG